MQKQGIGEDEARAYFQQLIMAIDYCHCLGIALRDIKVRSPKAASLTLQLLLTCERWISAWFDCSMSACSSRACARLAPAAASVVQVKLVLVSLPVPMQVDNMLLHWGAGAAAPVLKLCDFGYSKAEAAGEACTSACGTPEYMAPEVGSERNLRGTWNKTTSQQPCCYVRAALHLRLPPHPSRWRLRLAPGYNQQAYGKCRQKCCAGRSRKPG